MESKNESIDEDEIKGEGTCALRRPKASNAFDRNDSRPTSAKGSPNPSPPIPQIRLPSDFANSLLKSHSPKSSTPTMTACAPKINSAENKRKGPTLSTMSLNEDRSEE